MNSSYWRVHKPVNPRVHKPVNPKGNESCVFIGRTDDEAKAPILCPPDVKSWLIWRDPDARKDWRQEEKGTTENETVGWHHWLYGHGFEQAPEAGDGQGSLACCSPWVAKSQIQPSNWTELNFLLRQTLLPVTSSKLFTQQQIPAPQLPKVPVSFEKYRNKTFIFFILFCFMVNIKYFFNSLCVA